MAYNSDLLNAAKKFGAQYGIDPALLVATTIVESNGNLKAVGDGGKSFGPYQMYQGGRLKSAGFTPQQAMNPYLSTEAAAKEFAVYARKGMKGAQLAVNAQRPADFAGYQRKINAALPQARQYLSGQGGAVNNSLLNAAVTTDGAPAAGQSNQQTVLNAIMSRKPGQSASSAVRNALISNAVSTQFGGTPSDGRNPAGPGEGMGAADNALQIKGIERSGKPAVNAALSQLGVDYSWGGGSPSGPSKGFGRGANTIGFDCSSLVQYAWAKQGVKLPRTTYDQIKTGTAVNGLANAQPGDLIFPHTGHVQMYLGNGKIVEAPRTGGKVQVKAAPSKFIAIRRPG